MTLHPNRRARPRGRPWAALPLLLAVALLAAGCQQVASPQGWAAPRIADGNLYASIERGKLAALDPDDLSVLWVFPPSTDEGKKLKLEGIYAAPIVDGDTVYFGAYDDNIYALDAANGAPIWRFKTNDPVIGALTLADGTIFAGSTDGRLYAIDTSKCTNDCPPSAARTFDTGSSIWSSPLLVEDVIYVPAMDGRLHALNAGTLEPVSGFSFKVDAGLVMDPTLANDDTLLIGGLDSTLYAIDPATGDENWSFEGGNWFWGRPLVDGNTIYIADLDGNVNALNLTKGEPLWSDAFHAEAAVRSAPLLARDTLVIVDRDGNAYGLNPEDGTRQWGPTLLGKTVLSDPLLLERTTAPSPTSDAETASEVLIVAQGGDVCRLDPADGSPVAALLCIEVPL